MKVGRAKKVEQELRKVEWGHTDQLCRWSAQPKSWSSRTERCSSRSPTDTGSTVYQPNSG